MSHASQMPEVNGLFDRPCFPEETLVLTDAGLKSIEDIEINDMVLTHMNRFRRVRAVDSHKADTVLLSGYGHHGLECTPNHPFYAIKDAESQPEWVDAEHMVGYCWANVAEVPEEDVPPMNFDAYPTADREVLKGFTSVFFYFVGQYLGAGKLVTVAPESEGSVYKMIKIRCPYSMQDHARRFLDMFGIKYTIMNERSSCEFIISAAVLYDWLSKYFGDDATTKTLPTFVFGIPERRRRALLEGYVDARRPYYEPVTLANRRHELSAAASKKLAIGMKILAGTVGIPTDVGYVNLRHHRRIVESPTSNPMPFYQNVYANDGEVDQVKFEDGKWFGRVEEKLPGAHHQTVYSLDVEEDDSYTADGIVVHNCALVR